MMCPRQNLNPQLPRRRFHVERLLRKDANGCSGSIVPFPPTAATGSLPSVADVQPARLEDRSWPFSEVGERPLLLRTTGSNGVVAVIHPGGDIFRRVAPGGLGRFESNHNTYPQIAARFTSGESPPSGSDLR